jgi:multiple sugar transport system permease protein
MSELRARVRRQPARLVTAVGLAAVVVFAVFPLYWMLVNAIQPEQQRFRYPPSLVPTQPSLDAFSQVWTGTGIGRWLLNSLVVSTVSAGAVLACSSWAAYAMSRFRSRATGLAEYLTLATQMMPPVVLMIPLFKALVALHLVDGLTGLVVVDFFFALPVATWMLRSVFDGIPEEIEEAARMDGCSRLGSLTRITLPLAMPGVAAASVFAFTHSWEEYLFARVLISAPDKWIGSIGIASFFGEYHTPWPQVMACSALFTLPPVLLFLLVQRRFIDGVSGGLKG